MSTGDTRAGGGGTTRMKKELGVGGMVRVVAKKKEQTTSGANANWNSSSTTIKTVKIYNEAGRV